MSGSEYPSTLRCAHCGEQFDPDDALEIRVIGPSTALYRCPACGRFERSLPPQSGSGTSSEDSDSADIDETRRGFLKAAGTGAITAVGVGTLATDEASASSDGKPELFCDPDAPELPGWIYLYTTYRTDFCYWSRSACVYYATRAAWLKSAGKIVKAGKACAAQEGACRLASDIARITGVKWRKAHVYRGAPGSPYTRYEHLVLPVVK